MLLLKFSSFKLWEDVVYRELELTSSNLHTQSTPTHSSSPRWTKDWVSLFYTMRDRKDHVKKARETVMEGT